MHSYKYQNGFTIGEVVVVLAVLLIIFSIAIPQFARSRENQVLKAATADILSSVSKAQSQTLASVDSSSYGVHFQSDKVIIFKGTVFSTSDPDNEEVSIITPATISNVTLGGVSGNSGDVYFNRLSGSPNETGTITVSTNSFSKTITISATGNASVN